MPRKTWTPIWIASSRRSPDMSVAFRAACLTDGQGHGPAMLLVLAAVRLGRRASGRPPTAPVPPRARASGRGRDGGFVRLVRFLVCLWGGRSDSQVGAVATPTRGDRGD